MNVDAAQVKEIEKETNHDVKAVEYYVKKKLVEMDAQNKTPVAYLVDFVHFALTSEDVNNVAYACMIVKGRDALLSQAETATNMLKAKVSELAAAPMLSRTHGQPATPTTMGKELANFLDRLKNHCECVRKTTVYAKMNGAVGNYNAHMVAYPDVDWPKVARHALELANSHLVVRDYTTQIEPHEGLAALFDALSRFCTCIIALCRDLWHYIAFGYFVLKVNSKETGSSTMPHKVNPIDFENAEGNAGVAIALLDHMARKLPVSRFQRDLSDSTVLRNVGSAFGYVTLALDALMAGLDKITGNPQVMEKELEMHWEVLGEAVQTVMRKHQIPNAYEQLKNFSRGHHITKEGLKSFVATLELPKNETQRLLVLTPSTYLGNAVDAARRAANF